MRPDAAMFSPRESTPMSPDGSFEVVPYASDATSNGSTGCNKTTPREMIVHESIKGLVEEVAVLKARCDSLEAANAELRGTLGAIEQAFAAQSVSANGNLTGYASSQSSQDERGRSVASKELKPQHMDLIEQILKTYKEKLEAQAAQQQDFEKRLDRKCYDQTALKGRIGAVEKAMKSLKNEYEALIAEENAAREAETAARAAVEADIKQMKLSATEVKRLVRALEAKLESKGGDQYGLDRLDETDDSNFTEPASSNSGVTSYLNDKLEHMQVQLKMTTAEGQKLFDELSTKVEVLTAAVEGGGTSFATTSTPFDDASSSGKAPKASKQDIVDLKNWQGHTRRQAKNAQLIDEASTRDALYAMFFQLSAIMDRGDACAVWLEGYFQATSDEAFQLRDRVLCRLALFDKYAAALQEAQAQKGNVDW